jgi:hypothetical protein
MLAVQAKNGMAANPARASVSRFISFSFMLMRTTRPVAVTAASDET